ncbi:hypothetical protein APSETT444_003613 [Aspergillus pseudonomiae]
MPSTAVTEAVPPRTVIDIGSWDVSVSLRKMLEDRFLAKPDGQRHLPTALLCDEVGLEMWHKCAALPEFYNKRDEINLLRHWADEITAHIPSGAVLIDLGAGDVNKIKPILDQLESTQKDVTYYALDVSKESLIKCMDILPASYQHVKCYGLWGTFDDARVWSDRITAPRWFFSLGSIFGNDRFDIAVADLQKWSAIMRPGDRIFLGLDGCKDVEKVWLSYNDPQGHWHDFVRNGLHHSNRVLGHEWYRPEDWEITGVCGETPTFRYVIKAKRDVSCKPLDLEIKKGETILTTEWYKYGPEEMQEQFNHSGLQETARWESPSGPTCEFRASHFVQRDFRYADMIDRGLSTGCSVIVTPSCGVRAEHW